ncbi:MAG: hypothetical protein EXR98_12030 [Gemmataceae bacterium]|nr:hypothetical protein [Gemmataceae bacterium]
MNALADQRVADYLNESFVCTYLKVGTFQVVKGQKQGGNVASYFCLHDGGVLHVVPGQVNADKLLAESRWAYETRKAARTVATNLVRETTDMKKYKDQVTRAHAERYYLEQQLMAGMMPGGMMQGGMNQGGMQQGGGMMQGPVLNVPLGKNGSVLLPGSLPRHLVPQSQAHWLLARQPLAKLDTVYPVVWTQMLNEQLSTLPVVKR